MVSNSSESRLLSCKPFQNYICFQFDPTAKGKDSVRVVSRNGLRSTLAVARKKAKPYNAPLTCECFHSKSIHSRMYANPELGTSCNYPGCRCKAYHLKTKSKSK
jgi:hypothetical protein